MRALIAMSVVLAACAGDAATQTVWERFNDSADEVSVSVTLGDSAGPAVAADLHSTSGSRVVGQVLVDPGSGPVGTVHTVRVVIDDAYADRVGRVEIDADSGTRGTWTIPLDQDSAEAGLWTRPIASFGTDGEERDDVFVVKLYELTEVAPVSEVAE